MFNDPFEIISFDIESEDFNIFRSPEFNFCGFFDGKKAYHFYSISESIQFMLDKIDSQPFYNEEHTIKRGVIFLAHNIQFDFWMLFHESGLPDGLKVDIISVNGRFPHFCKLRKITYVKESTKKGCVVSTKTKTVNQYIYFIDTMNFIKRSIKDIIPYYTPELENFKTDEFGILRNLADIITTRRLYVENFMQFKVTRHYVRPFITISSISDNTLNTMCNYEWTTTTAEIKRLKGLPVTKKDLKTKYRPKWLKDIERSAYHGAIVSYNPKFLGKRLNAENMNFFDVNSLYPSVMEKLKVIVGYKSKKTLYITELNQSYAYIKAQAQIEDEFRLYKVNMVCNVPAIPYNKPKSYTKTYSNLPKSLKQLQTLGELYDFNIMDYYDKSITFQENLTSSEEINLFLTGLGLTTYTYQVDSTQIELIYPTQEQFTGWYYENELLSALENGYIDSLELITEITYIAEKEKFKPFVEHFNTIKMQEPKMSPKRDTAKLILNSSYGKKGERKRITKIIKDKDIIGYIRENEITELDGMPVRDDFGIVYQEKVLQEESYNAVTSVAGQITAGARAIFSTVAFKKNASYEFVNGDCDSVMIIGDLPNKYKDSKALGKWKNEWEDRQPSYVQIFGHKHYNVIYKIDNKLYVKHKAKGLPFTELSVTVKLNSSEYEFYHVVKPNEAKRLNKQPYTLVRIRKKFKYINEYETFIEYEPNNSLLEQYEPK